MGNHTAKNSEKTVKNLKPFPKGKSGNPNGRPKKLPALEELLLSNMSEEKDGIMAVDLVIKKLRQKAIQGDMKAIEYLLDRVYGKMKESASISIQNPEKEYSDEELKEELKKRKLPVLDIEEYPKSEQTVFFGRSIEQVF